MNRLFNFVRFKLEKKNWYNYYDHVFFSYQTKFLGSLIFRGKKQNAYNLFLKVKESLKIKEQVDPSLVFLVALLNITPQINLKPMKMGSSLYGVPMPISETKKITLAIKWLFNIAKSKNKKIDTFVLVDLIISSAYKKGDVIKKKMDYYSLAARNRFLIKKMFL